LADDLRLRERQQIVVALDVVLMVLEAFAAIFGFAEVIGLDHRPHGAIEDEDARVQGGFELEQTAGGHRKEGRAFKSRKLLIAKGGILARRAWVKASMLRSSR